MVAGDALPAATRADTGAITRALARLCPEDRLLRRDTDRYCSQRCQEPPAPAPVARPAPPVLLPAGKARPIRAFHLPKGFVWTNFAAANCLLYAAGFDEENLPSLLVQNWEGNHQILRFNQRFPTLRPLLLAPDPGEARSVLLAWPFGRRLSERESDAGDGGALRAGLPSWAPDQIVGMAWDGAEQVWMLCMVDQQLHASCYSRRGELRHSHLLALLADVGALPIPLLLARDNGLWFAIRDRLFWDHGDGTIQEARFPSSIYSLSATISHSVGRVAVTLSVGGRVLLTGSQWPQQVKFGEDMIDPLAAFTNTGLLIAAARTEGRMYELRGGDVRFLGESDMPTAAPLAVLCTASANQFAVVTDDNQVRVFQGR